MADPVTLTLTWPEGRSPGNGYPFCPGCGHDFGQHSSGLVCPTCHNAGTPCTVDQGAVFDAMEAARAAMAPASAHEPQIIAFCSCGWESSVFEAGASAQDAYAAHCQEAGP